MGAGKIPTSRLALFSLTRWTGNYLSSKGGLSFDTTPNCVSPLLEMNMMSRPNDPTLHCLSGQAGNGLIYRYFEGLVLLSPLKIKYGNFVN